MNRDKLYPNLNLEEEDWRRSMLELIRGLREDTYDKINEPVSRFRATRGTVQSIPNIIWTKVQYNTEDFDNLGEYDHVTNFRFTAQKAGYYQVNASILTTNISLTVDKYCMIAVYKDGNRFISGFRWVAPLTHSFYVHSVCNGMVYLTAGQYLEIFCYQDSGAAINIHYDETFNCFSVHRLS